jgi:hypothetical protein
VFSWNHETHLGVRNPRSLEGVFWFEELVEAHQVPRKQSAGRQDRDHVVLPPHGHFNCVEHMTLWAESNLVLFL